MAQVSGMSGALDDPDLERFDGMPLAEALQFCVRRSMSLSIQEVKFIHLLIGKKKPPRSDEVMRLRNIVTRLRQGNIEDAINGAANGG